MRVANLLAVKGSEVASISQERSVTDALATLKERGIGALIVTGPTPPLVGIFSERDVVRALAERGASVLEASVADLMSSEVTVCNAETTVTELMGLMTARRIRHVPVVADGHLIGMISIGDVVKARLDELEHEKKELLDYVSSW
ncbi:MAG: CBS domain-containing protein [Acidimicrobiaceae bacterium]|nr:CBS domain-containing protein [Acidimicrobiaceae bacterium]